MQGIHRSTLREVGGNEVKTGGSGLLGLEAASVIALRSARIAAGGAATNREIVAMFAEKIASALTLQTLASTNGLGDTPQAVAAKALAHFRPKVRVNRRRLAKKYRR